MRFKMLRYSFIFHNIVCVVARICFVVGGLASKHPLRSHLEKLTEAWGDRLQDTQR